MNEVLRDFINMFVVVYLDDILIFSRTKKDHLRYLDMVLGRLDEDKLIINLKKCEWNKEEGIFGVCDCTRGLENGSTKGRGHTHLANT